MFVFPPGPFYSVFITVYIKATFFPITVVMSIIWLPLLSKFQRNWFHQSIIFFFLEVGIAIESSTDWFLLNAWSEVILNSSLIFLIKTIKTNQMKRCTSQHGGSVHTHTHKHPCPYLQRQIPSYFIFCTCLNSWPLVTVLCWKGDNAM